MLTYCLRRIITIIPVLLGISLLTFMLGVFSPGNPAEFALDQNGIYTPTEAQIAAMSKELGTDKPFHIQYRAWLSQLLQGNLGKSYISGKEITAEIKLRLPVTIKLSVLSLFFAGVGGIVMGLCASNRKNTLFNNLTHVMLSIPSFWIAMLLILFFCEILKIFPTGNEDGFKNYILPSLACAVGTLATVARFTRGAIIQEFGKQYFFTAKMRGLKKNRLLFHYALPNALIPITALLGNYFAAILGGSVITESIFSLPGIGIMAIEAIRYRDYPTLQAYVLISGCSVVLVTTVVDIITSYLNPKINLGDP